jgi:hypothetical protein
MDNCHCNCKQKTENQEALGDEKKIYICLQCNTFTAIPSGRVAPECCGKKMQVLE